TRQNERKKKIVDLWLEWTWGPGMAEFVELGIKGVVIKQVNHCHLPTVIGGTPFRSHSENNHGAYACPVLRGRRQSRSWVIVIFLLRNLAIGVDREAVHNAQ